MQRINRIVLVIALFAGGLAATSAFAADDIESRLREALRSATLQQRALEDERTQLQAKNTANEQLIVSLRQQIEELSSQASSAGKNRGNKRDDTVDRSVVEQFEAEMRQRFTALNETIVKLNEALEKWRVAYQEAATVARAKEAERAQLAGQAEQMANRINVCETNNGELFKVGNEILDRFAGRGGMSAMLTKEPFLGLKRVELQNLEQDYRDKLLDQKAKP